MNERRKKARSLQLQKVKTRHQIQSDKVGFEKQKKRKEKRKQDEERLKRIREQTRERV